MCRVRSGLYRWGEEYHRAAVSVKWRLLSERYDHDKIFKLLKASISISQVIYYYFITKHYSICCVFHSQYIYQCR